MRFQKRYILLFAIVSLVTFIKFTVGLDDFVNVEQFRGADIQNGVFYPMIAQSINRNRLVLLTARHCQPVSLYNRKQKHGQQGLF